MRFFSRILLLTALGVSSQVASQPFHRGYLTSLNSGEPIVGARIANSSESTVSNLEGYFYLSAKVEGGVDTLLVEAFGFESDTLYLAATTDLLQVKLRSFELQTVTVAGSNLKHTHLISPSLAQLKTTPVILGQPDVLKSLTVYPGIAGGQEGLTGLHVRGGNADQNLIRLDGSTIYNPGHLFGFLSVFNPDIVRNIDIYKDYLPGKFGGRLSSVIDVQSRNGSPTKTTKTKEIGLISLGYTQSGPLRDSSWTYLAAGRLAHSGALTLGTLPGYLAASSPLLMSGMYDLNLKLSKSYASGSRLVLGGYLGDDFFGSLARSRDAGNSSSYLRYGNRTFSLRYFTPVAQNWYSESLLNFNRYASGYRVNEELVGQDTTELTRYKNTGHISEITLQQAISTDISNQLSLRFGLEALHRWTEPVQLELGQNGETFVPDRFQLRSSTYTVFSDATLRPTEYLSVDFGLRYSLYRVAAENYSFSALEPRLALNYEIVPDLLVSTQYLRTTQPLHAINNRSGGLPITFWIPASSTLKPQTGNSYGISLAYLGHEQTELKVGGFIRTMNDLIELPTGEFSGVNNTDWQNNLAGAGKGRSYGLEGYYRRVFNAFGELSISYTYSRSLRRFATINRGEEFPFDFDRPHDLFLQFRKRLSLKWDLVGAFTFQTGRPVNVAEAVGPPVFTPGDVNFFATTKNNGRYPDFHRLDLVFVKHITTKRGRTGELKLGMYNVYGKVNPVDLNYSLLGRINRELGFIDYEPIYRSEALFRFFPIISHSVTW